MQLATRSSMRRLLAQRSYATTAKGNVAGTMMDFPLTMNHFFERAENIFYDREIVTNSPAGITRTTYGDWAVRTRKLGGVLDKLGIEPDARVGTFAWNTARHLETWTDAKTEQWGAATAEEGAAKRTDANDVINARLIECCRPFADLVIDSV